MEIHRYYETQKQQQNSENNHHHKLQTQEEEEEIIAVKGVSPKKRPAPTQRLLNPPTTSTTTSPLKGKENTEEDVVNENEYTAVPFTPTEGEDYYFRVPLPRQDAPVADPVALGRVVKVHCHYNNNNNTQEVTSVTMQLYEVKSMFMQANPFSPNQIEQRTVVRLSGEQTTVAVTSLWAEVPVYVITPSLQRHVYFLEESE
ncbi:hypothetical protein AGDE_17048 [Angomonas deanei]|uniref:Uncharacterized protein n=1 Tax=Angomonas deanei TaxID=59799 RepID=A0A7G2CHN9_9TRYP|nr:hypothetical protein AGDE_17048 [Angomonas deanei]CAD2218203.1 hypothetical protein, conserved [Angomonas deanei]|eukprot:EPY15613.1 hypothetical protein AGDE_17048 [Angomonas deanei]